MTDPDAALLTALDGVPVSGTGRAEATVTAREAGFGRSATGSGGRPADR